jgi:hypothetical protein
MAKNEKKQISEKVVETITFTKEKILNFKKYSHRIDLLNVLLDDGKAYTTDEVDALIDNFMKGKVK